MGCANRERRAKSEKSRSRRGAFPRLCCAAAALVLAAAPAAARKLFTSNITVGANTLTSATNTLSKVPDLFDEAAIAQLFPGFTSTSNFSAALDLRGVSASLDYDGTAGELRFGIPGVTPTVTFSEGSLFANLDAFESWLEGDFNSATAPENFVTNLLQALVARSPVDPVAGNPNSLMTRMTQVDYQLGSEGPFLHGSERLPDAPDQTGVGLEVGYARGGAFDVDTYELPLDHRFNLRSAQNLSLLVSFPISGTRTEGKWTAMGSLGLGFQYRITDLWALTPMVRLGVVGSIDVGAAALLYSGTLTSHFEVPVARYAEGLDGITLAITNQMGWAETADGVKIGDLELDYDLTNFVFRNGGYLRGSFGSGTAWGWKIYGTDARWAGDELFLEASSDVGVALVAMQSVADRAFEAFEIHAGYLGNFGDYDGVRVGLRGRF